jgi:hypothetical protein
MLTAGDVRKAALALPEAYEAMSKCGASFRVNKKIFCTLHTAEPRIMLKLDPEDQHNLSDGAIILPVPGAWGRKGSTFIPSSTTRSWTRSGCPG